MVGCVAVYIASWKGKRVLFVHCHLYIDRSVPQCPLLTAGHLEGERKKKSKSVVARVRGGGAPTGCSCGDWREKKNNLYYLYIACASLEKARHGQDMLYLTVHSYKYYTYII